MEEKKAKKAPRTKLLIKRGDPKDCDVPLDNTGVKIFTPFFANKLARNP